MLRLSATTRITLGLAGMLSSVLLLAPFFGLIPDQRREAFMARTRLCETIAINFSALASRTSETSIKTLFGVIAERNPDLLSLGVRRENGRVVIEVGNHTATWKSETGQQSTETHIIVPILSNEKRWGQVEMHFRPVLTFGIFDNWIMPELFRTVLLTMVCFIAFYVYLRRVLHQLDPSRVVPSRVRSALDTLTEGLLVMDQNERVVLANLAFHRSAGTNEDTIIGKGIHTLPLVNKDEVPEETMPWTEAIAKGTMVTGRLFGMRGSGKEKLTYSVSAAPINDEKGCRRGVLASFEDVSRLEEKKVELKMMVDCLRQSSEEIKSQNRELERLATRDPLTGCLNRRALFERFEAEWESSARHQYPISAIMVDLDHFKSVNDTFGHAMGDEVLRRTGAAVEEMVRAVDIVARYGGEEFAVILPRMDMDAAHAVAERIRLVISELKFDKLSVTSSLGVASRTPSTTKPTDLLEQADKCLYVAKRNGRNQAVRFDTVPTDLVVDEKKISRTKPTESSDEAPAIPFQVVTALISTLAYRDPNTAAHSRRVADLCFAVGEGLMSLTECYLLEIAALLHDIGKVGVPDAILLKPSPLTDDEWQTMRKNDKIGVEIVRASFASPKITEIIEHYQSRFSDPENLNRPQGLKIPLGARILGIADAYDAMMSDRAFRRAITRQEAIAELRRWAGKQFDPELVERFIKMTGNVESDFTTVNGASKELALAIGQQLEQFCRSLDKQDFPAISAMSQRLATTAIKHGANEIAEKASELNAILEGDRDLIAILQNANELLEICRSTQVSFIK